MNGPQDLGGQMGFGPVDPRANDAALHEDWERRVLGLVLCAGAMGLWSIDASRHARESLHPAIYYNASYFEIWLRGLEALLLHHGVVTRAELEAGTAVRGDAAPALHAADVPAALARGGPCDRPVAPAARFAPGDRVRARIMHPRGHTRLPRYVRGHVGTVEAAHGGFVLPDSHAHGQGEAPEHLYTVVFDGAALWGPDAEPGLQICVDAWESYLEPA